MITFPIVSLCTFLVVCGVSGRMVNITYLDNCQDEDSKLATVRLKDVTYHITEDGTCDIVHGKIDVQTLDTEIYVLQMTLFKCAEKNMATPCMSNPSMHEEQLDCDRLMNDDSGPWHMFSSAMEGGQCGDQVGVFDMTFARFKLEYLMKYLDVYDDSHNTFRLKMNFKSTLTNKVRGCGELDFTLS